MDLINLNKGEKVIYNDKEVIITRLNTVDSVTIEELSTGINHLVQIPVILTTQFQFKVTT